MRIRKIVVAFDSFKGSMTSYEAGKACKEGILAVCADTDVTVISVGDGGEGTVDALAATSAGEQVKVKVHGPLGELTEASYICDSDGKRAFMEMSAASGLTLVEPCRRNPLKTSTTGVGELILDALDRGCRRITIGLGGSATVDGGCGMFSALGVRFFNGRGCQLDGCGSDLKDIASIDISGLDDRLANTEITAICDVDNPLLGERGAAHIFGPQKGASASDVEILEYGMTKYIRLLESTFGRQISDMPGGGAAGGLGAALHIALGARITGGIDYVLDRIGFDTIIKGSDLVVTGEGSVDHQSLHGKAISGILSACQRVGVPVVVLAGSVEDSDRITKSGIAAVLPIVSGPCRLADAMDTPTACRNMRRTSEQMMRLMRLEYPDDQNN